MSKSHNKVRARMQAIEEKANAWLLHLHRYKSQRTRKSYERVLRLFLKHTSQVRQITAEDIETFILTRRKTCSARSCNHDLAVLKSYYRWLNDNYGIPNVVKRVQQLKTLPPKQHTIDPKDYQKLISATNGSMRAIIILLANTGLRRAEFCSLSPENLNNGFLVIVGKGQKQRKIPLNQTVKTILSDHPNLDFPKNVRHLNRLFNKASEISSVKVTPHSLRHYFATSLYNHGVPILIISKLLGHTSVTTTETYLHIQENELLHVTDCLG